MMLLLLALRNLGRNRRRTALALLVIAAGAAALLLTRGFVRFSYAGLREAIVVGGLGHLEIVPAGAAAASPALADWETLRAAVEGREGVVGAAGTIDFSGIVSRAEAVTAFVGVASEPDRERRMGWRVRLRRGEPLLDAAPPPGEDRALLGEGLADVLGAQPGDFVTLLVVRPDGSLDALDVSVAGVITTGLQELDARLIKVHLASAQRLLGTNATSRLVIGLASFDDVAPVEAELAPDLRAREPPLRVTRWEERAPFYGQVRGLYDGIFWFLGAIVVVLTLLAASNALLMALLERTREMGVMLAMGTSRLQLALLLILEGSWMGALGGLAGASVAVVTALALESLGVRLPPPPGATDPIDLRLDITVGDALGVVALMILVLAAAATLPALRAIRLRIIDALRNA